MKIDLVNFTFSFFQMMVILLWIFGCVIECKEFEVTVLKTYKVNSDDQNSKGFDYMEMVPDSNKTVQLGRSVDIICSSSEKISKCYFYGPDGLVRYEMKKGAKFSDGRLQCLCDVRFLSRTYDL